MSTNILPQEPAFGEPCLESEVERGDAWERTMAKEEAVPLYVPVTLPRCPLLMYENLLYLRDKHENLGSISKVSMYATRTGVIVLSKMNIIAELGRLRRQAYKGRDELALAVFSNWNYKPPTTLGREDRRMTARLFQWVAGWIADFAADLGLPNTEVLILVLATGLAQSTRWLPREYADLFVQYVKQFLDYVDARVQIARRLVAAQ